MKKNATPKPSGVQKTKRLTVSALLCALGAVLLCAGRLFDGSLDLSMAVLASLITVWAAEELDGYYPWLIWLVTAILALLLMPFNTAAWEYLLFAGVYPMLRVMLEKLPLVLRLIIKPVLFNAVIALGVLVLWQLLFPTAESYPAALGAPVLGEAAAELATSLSFSQAAKEIKNGEFLPTEITVGDTKIGPADWLFAALDVLQGAKEVTIGPRAQLPSLDIIPETRDAYFKGTWRHSDSFEDKYLSDRLRLQAWTLRFANLNK